MQATVVSITPLRVIVRRSYRQEGIWESNKLVDLHIGDKIEVRRETNNPYLVFVAKNTKL